MCADIWAGIGQAIPSDRYDFYDLICKRAQSGRSRCSRSLWRAATEDKRMVLVHKHGLFITSTEFRLSTTFIPIVIIMCT
jgi:hypothetical protein